MSGPPNRRLLKPIVRAPLVGLALSVLLSVFGVACTDRTDKDATPVLTKPPSTAFPMPPLNARAEMGWVLSDGSRARLADYRGKVLVLDFYATWCEPCRKSIPRLVALQNEYGARDLALVGLNVGGPDDRIKVSNFAKELGIQYPLGFPDQALADLFLSDNQTIPQTFIFRRDGTLQKRFIGYDRTTEDGLEQEIGAAMNSNYPTPAK